MKNRALAVTMGLFLASGFAFAGPGSFKPGTEPDGFRGMVWGTDPSGLSGFMLTPTLSPGREVYVQKRAPNWIFVTRWDCEKNSSAIIHCKLYVDASSVVITGDTIRYWTLSIHDQARDELMGEKQVTLMEAFLGNPRRTRSLESRVYDSNNHEIDSFLEPGEWKDVTPDECYSRMKSLLDAALRYARR